MASETPEIPPAKTRGPYPKGVARRQQILDRAIEVFATRGSARTSLRSIAEEIGVSHAALTHYFRSREDLLVEVYREAESRAGELEPHDPDTTAVTIMMRSAERNRAIPGLVQLYSTLVAAGLEEGHADAQAFASERFARIRGELAERVRRNQRSGLLRSDVDPAVVASLVIAASDGLQTQWLLDPTVPQTEALELLERLLADPDAG